MPKLSSRIAIQIVRVAGSRSIRAEISPALGAAVETFMSPPIGAAARVGAGVGLGAVGGKCQTQSPFGRICKRGR